MELNFLIGAPDNNLMSRILFLLLAIGSIAVRAADPATPPAEPARVAGSLIELKREAESGNRKSQKLYADALKQNQLYAAAENWYRLGATQGDASALCALGDLYQRDEGYGTNAVRKNLTNAVVLYKLAALQGYGPAHLALSLAYREGVAVPRDLTKSYYHNLIQTGNREQIARDLVLQMTQEQIVEAERMAKEFQPAPFVKAFEEMVFESIRVTGIMGSESERMAFIQGGMVVPGSFFRTSIAGIPAVIKCVGIGRDSITVSFNGVQRAIAYKRSTSTLVRTTPGLTPR
jgi:hypothetical protein